MNDRDLTTWRLRVGLPASLPARTGPPRGDLSANKVKLLDKCELAYSLGKIEKLDERPTDAMFRGILCHRVLETVARARLMGVRRGRPSEAELRECLREEAARFRSSSAVIASTWDVLEDQADRLDFERTFSIEENFTVLIPQDALGGPAFKLVGTIDRLDAHHDVEAGTEVVHIQDYKSGSFVASVGELLVEPQVLFYVAAIRAGGWGGPIRVTFHYLGAGMPTTFLAPANLAQKGLDLAMTKMAEIRGKQEWKASTGPHCTGCDFRTSCPAYAKLVKSNGEAFPVGSDADLLREYVRCRTLAKVFDDHKSQCGDALKAKLANTEIVIGGGLRAQMVSKTKTRLPESVETVATALATVTGRDPGAIVTEISGVNERRLKKLVSGLPAEQRTQAEEALDALREPFDVASSIDVRAVKGF